MKIISSKHADCLRMLAILGVTFVLLFSSGVWLANIYHNRHVKSPQQKHDESVQFITRLLQQAGRGDIIAMQNSSVWIVLTNEHSILTLRGMTSMCRINVGQVAELIKYRMKCGYYTSWADYDFVKQFTATNGLTAEAEILQIAATSSAHF